MQKHKRQEVLLAAPERVNRSDTRYASAAHFKRCTSYPMPAMSPPRSQRSYSGVLIVRAAILCCVLMLVASSVFAQAASQPLVRSSGPQQAKASEARPFASAAKVSLAPPQASAAEKSPEHSNPSSHKSWNEIWLEKLRDDPIVAFTLVLAISTVLLWIDTRGLRRLAQRQAADTTKALGIATVAAEAAKKSADASLATLRPWLSCKVKIMEPMTFNETGDPIFRFRFSVRNVGDTPAMSVNVTQELRLFAPGVQHSVHRLQTLAALMQGLGVQKPNKDRTFSDVEKMTAQGQIVNPVGHVLFPGEVLRQYLQMPISKAWILECSKNMKTEVHFWPELIVLVSYVYNMAETHAITGLVFNLSKARLMPFKLGEPVPVDDMEIALHHMWGGFAT